jgi:hypothetical protein
MKRKLAGTGLAIGLIAGAGAGLIMEMSGSAGAAGKSIAASVAATGDTVPADAVPAAAGDDSQRPDPSTHLQDVLKPLVADGTITQAQADKVIAALVAAHPDGDGPMGGHRGMGGPMGRRAGADLDIVATTLGITADEVRTALKGGQTLADLAVSKGKTAQAVIDAIVADATKHITAEVTAGTLTQAEADKRLADLTTRVTDFVNNGVPAGPGMGGPGMGGGGFGGPGHRGDGNDDDNTVTDDTTVTTAG